MEQVNAWKCEFCNRVFLRRVSTHNHEVACGNNPLRRHCITCVHSELAPTYPFEHDRLRREMVPWCAFHDAPLHSKPYYLECDTDNGDNGYREEAPLPGTCWHYEYKGYARWTEPVKREVEGRP